LNLNQKFLIEAESNVFLCQVMEVDAVNAEELTGSPATRVSGNETLHIILTPVQENKDMEEWLTTH
jgi:hypothetical protein